MPIPHTLKDTSRPFVITKAGFLKLLRNIMDVYVVSFAVIGFAFLLMSWMPAISREARVSYSIIYVLFGMLLYLVSSGLPIPNPIKHQTFTLHFTELIVIISIMGTGLKIDEPFKLKTWAIPLRLVSITMLVTITLVAVAAHYFLAFDWPSAVLIGAVLAPTDPVLASDVQVGPPQQGDKGIVRFSLTAEAGMNDGMAFPFTWLAIALAIMSKNGDASITDWLWMDVLYRIAAGVIAGFLIGRLLAFLVFYLPEKNKKLYTLTDGFVAVSATLLVYGLTEMIHGYGFIAVFISALTLRDYERDHKYHRKLHDFTDQIERMLIAVVLILFGGAIATGLFNPLTWKMALLGIGFIVIIRPVSVFLSLADIKIHKKERRAIGFFGIRGIGSFFYLAFALSQTDFSRPEEIWALVGFIVLISIIIHGVSATTVMEKLPENVSTIHTGFEPQDGNKVD